MSIRPAPVLAVLGLGVCVWFGWRSIGGNTPETPSTTSAPALVAPSPQSPGGGATTSTQRPPTAPTVPPTGAARRAAPGTAAPAPVTTTGATAPRQQLAPTSAPGSTTTAPRATTTAVPSTTMAPAPATCSLALSNTTPSRGERITMTLTSDAPRQLFAVDVLDRDGKVVRSDTGERTDAAGSWSQSFGASPAWPTVRVRIGGGSCSASYTMAD